MGTLLSIHRDVLKRINKNYLDEHDRILLAWSVGIKSRLNIHFIAKYSICCEGYYPNIVLWALENDGPFDNFIMTSLAEFGRLDIMKLLYEKDRNHSLSVWTGAYAAMNGHIHVLKWLRDVGFNFRTLEVEHAAGHGQIETLKWLKENKYPINRRTFGVAAIKGQTKVLKWMIENKCIGWEDYV